MDKFFEYAITLLSMIVIELALIGGALFVLLYRTMV
jgi:hypothetical protein